MVTSTKDEILAAIEIPDRVTVIKEDDRITVMGRLGTLQKDFTRIPATLSIRDKKVIIEPYGTRRKDLAIINTVRSIIYNMVKGVENGFTYKLKIIYAHFPISVKVKGSVIHIENYFGERSPRRCRIVGDTTRVSIAGDEVLVQGPSLEHVSQTAANIEFSTKLKGKDQRVFLDGLYIYSKREGMS